MPAAVAIHSGEVVRAVRNSSGGDERIREGDWLGMSPEGMVSVAPALLDAARRLLKRLLEADRPQILTVLEGEGSSPEATEGILAWLAQTRPEVGVRVL